MTDTSDIPMQLATQLMHAGNAPDPTHGAPQTPLYQSVSFNFPSAETAANRFQLKEFGQIYSRLTNPTTDALEARLAALEGGVGAVATASGHAAQMLAFASLLSPGDHIVGSNRLYGGSTSQLTHTFPAHFGWQSTLADADEPESFKRAITEKTKVIFVEALANPGGVILDIEAIARIAEEAHIPLIVDNTMATPYLFKPLDWGANAVSYSTTKFMNGHGNALGGALIDGGNFDWGKDDRFPHLTEPCAGYNGLKFYETFGNMALFVHTKGVGQREFGPTQQPMNAFLTLMGMETLHVRMQRHCENALEIAHWLESHDQVESVSYPGLKTSKYYPLVQKYLPNGAGAVFTFDIKGDLAAAQRFIEALKMFSFVANIGDTRSLLIHPASTTHSQLAPEHRAKLGIADGTMRVSIGLEDTRDIIADLERGFAAAASCGEHKKAG
jgi:O-acetylhomoserine (thiol)-lyase